jgi:hypothetical protein
MTRSAALITVALAAACTGGMPSVTGTAATSPANAAELKTAALRGARLEISRTTGNGATVYGVYLDTLVGPTPAEYLYSWAHPREWLEAMIASKQVDGLFGVGGARRGIPRTAVAVEIGEPYPAGGDTLEVAYDWCLRRLPAERGTGGRASSWRDAFVRADTGWTRVRHLPTVILSACTP